MLVHLIYYFFSAQSCVGKRLFDSGLSCALLLWDPISKRGKICHNSAALPCSRNQSEPN